MFGADTFRDLDPKIGDLEVCKLQPLYTLSPPSWYGTLSVTVDTSTAFESVVFDVRRVCHVMLVPMVVQIGRVVLQNWHPRT